MDGLYCGRDGDVFTWAEVPGYDRSSMRTCLIRGSAPVPDAPEILPAFTPGA
jgi:hypothetical protein